MEDRKKYMERVIGNFKLPRYCELPGDGLYLEQTVRYINQYMEQLGWPCITASMVSNYVKKGVIPGPVKKQYYEEQIAHLMVIAIVKSAISLENMCQLFHMQKEVYTNQTAYDYFCSELENALCYSYGIRKNMTEIEETASQIKKMLRSLIIAISNMMYLNSCFQIMELKTEE